MIDGKPVIAVLGADRKDLPDDALTTSVIAARELTQGGYAVITRAGPGVSTAVMKETLGQKGVVVAVTSGGEAPGDRVPAGAEVVEAQGPLAAMQVILERADAAIVLEPDVETLALVLQIWAFGSTPDAPYRQVILVGDAWRVTIKTLADAAGLDARTRAMVTFADTPSEAVESLRYYVAP